MRKGKVRWGAVWTAVAGVAALISSPAVLAVLTVKQAAAVVFATQIIATFQKPAVRKEHERVVRESP